VRLVIADTGPINYLVLIGNVDLLPVLFEKVILPSAVEAELADPDAPPSVRNWIADPPAWLDVQETPARQFEQASVEGLDEGRQPQSRWRFGSTPIWCSWTIGGA
jgi:predicted nucleic acid-binding protein